MRAKTGAYVAPVGVAPVRFDLLLKGQAFAGYNATKSGRHLVYQLVVNNVLISDINEVLRVFQDEGTASAILWRDN